MTLVTVVMKCVTVIHVLAAESGHCFSLGNISILKMTCSALADLLSGFFPNVQSQCFAAFRGHSGPINDVVLAGTLVATASADATVRVWREKSAEPLHVLFSGAKGPLRAEPCGLLDRL